AAELRDGLPAGAAVVRRVERIRVGNARIVVGAYVRREAAHCRGEGDRAEVRPLLVQQFRPRVAAVRRAPDLTEAVDAEPALGIAEVDVILLAQDARGRPELPPLRGEDLLVGRRLRTGVGAAASACAAARAGAVPTGFRLVGARATAKDEADN